MEVFAVPDVPEIRPGDDIGAIVTERVNLTENDVVCVASTAVSKAEGRQADLDDFTPSEHAVSIADRIGSVAGERKDPRFAQAVLEESEEILLEAPFILSVTRFGHITVNAGIDRSNVQDADMLCLPEDPNASARRLHEKLDAAVVLTDTSGRPFRNGQRGVAIGWAGIPAMRDWRGERDRHGRELTATVEAVVDELAATANLLTGEGAGGRPVAIVRGWGFGDHDASDSLFRSREQDLVREALLNYEYETKGKYQ